MSRPAKSLHGEWTSRWAFILAATGAAVGLGNIWKFPYIAGENGGGAFVLVYLACIAFIGVPVMMAEILIGRRGRQNPFNSIESLAVEQNSSHWWKYIGGMGVLAGFLILSYYSVVAGQALAYTVRTFSGAFEGVTPDGARNLYLKLVEDPERMLAWHTIFMVLTMMIVSRGVQRGLEKSVRFLMPGLFLILLTLVGYAYAQGEAFDRAVTFLFKPDFSVLTAQSVLVAMGHAFFTLSLGMGAIMVYGSYLPQKASILKMTLSISAMDTIVAVLAGLAIFPLVFANGMSPGAGPSLIFESLPLAFGHMPYGTLFGGLFFLLLVFAALSSAIALVEPVVTWLVENFEIKRLNASIWVGVLIWLLGLFNVFSFNIGKDWTLAGMTVFQLLDYLTANIMLPLGGLLIAIFAGWIMRSEHTQDELAFKFSTIYFEWRFLVRYVTPVSIVIIFASLIGLFGL